MTTKERLLKFALIDNGMFPEQAEQLFQQNVPSCNRMATLLHRIVIVNILTLLCRLRR